MGPASRSLPILAILVLLAGAEDGGAVWKGLSVSCNSEEAANASVSCHGIRLVRRIVQKLLEDAARKRTLEILDGVSLVEREDGGTNAMDARQLKGFGQMDTFVRFLESRELRIKLPTLLPNNLEAAIKESLPSIDQGRGHGGGFGGGKKGDGGVMLMALMMGKMMAAMGFGALGLLAMKALMVSSLALMLSLIVAAKKLASSKDDDSGHHVVYAQEVSHHRRRRSLDNLQENFFNQPYRGYMHLSHSILKS